MFGSFICPRVAVIVAFGLPYYIAARESYNLDVRRFLRHDFQYRPIIQDELSNKSLMMTEGEVEVGLESRAESQASDKSEFAQRVSREILKSEGNF